MHWLLAIVFALSLLHQGGHCQSIDLDTAWQRVICYAPSLAAADAEVSVLAGEARQVSIMLNPVLEIESENLGVSDPSDDVEPPQTTFSLSHTLELGGKRKARFRLASSISCIAYWEAQIERENARLELITAFIDVCAAQERVCLAEQRLIVLEKTLELVIKQIQNGKVSPIQEKRVRMELMAERLARRDAFSQLEQAKTHLSSMWGSSCPDFDSVDFDLFDYAPPPCEAEVIAGFYQTPDYTKAQQTIASAKKNLMLQKANGIPDLTLMAGYRIFHDSNEGGWVVGAQVPLPIFNRNQGGVRSATCELSQAEYQLDEVTREATERILLAHERLTVSFEETDMMCKRILTEAEETVELTRKGYRKGKLDYFDFLDAQRMLFAIQEKYIDVLYEYHRNRAELARLSGMES